MTSVASSDFAGAASDNIKPKAANAANANTILRIFFSIILMTINGASDKPSEAELFQ
jgi:hypothetical protein